MFPSNGALSEQVGISGPGSSAVNGFSTSVTYDIAASANATQGWLSIPIGGPISDLFAVAVNPSGLVQGTYVATIVFTSTGTCPGLCAAGAATVPVVYTVQSVQIGNPTVSGLSPSSPTIGGPQLISISGSNFETGLTVTLIAPDELSSILSGQVIQNVTSSGFQMLIPFPIPGQYSLQVQNPDGGISSPLLFNVAAIAVLASFANQSVTTQAPSPSSGCVAPTAVTSFLTTNNTVYLYFEATVTMNDSLSSNWLAPDGTEITGSRGIPYSGTYCFNGASLNISNLPAAKLGAWQAQVYDNGNLLFAVPFTVAAPTIPTTMTQALPHLAVGSSWTTDVFVINTGAQPANFSIAFYDNNGNPMVLPFSGSPTSTLAGTVQGQGLGYFEASSPSGQLIEGWGQVTADPSIVVQALFRQDDNGAYYEAAVPSDSGSNEFLIPFDATTFAAAGVPFYTGFAIANMDQTPATITCTARSSNGSVISNGVQVPPLSPLGHWSNYLFPALAGQRGTIDCNSSTNIALPALRFASAPGVPSPSLHTVINNPASLRPSPQGSSKATHGVAALGGRVLGLQAPSL